MLNVLVAVDGSEYSDRAVDYLIHKKDWFREPMEIHLLNVQLPLVGVNVKLFIRAEDVKAYYHDEGLAALKSSRAKLDAAGISYAHHIGVGDPAQVIVEYAKDKGCDQIVMGTHGRGSLAGALMGSVTRKVLHLADVPVLLVK